MKVTTQQAEKRQVILEIEMEPAELNEALDHAYHHLVARYAVPGFRKGKAPRNILERHIGKAAFTEEAVEHWVPEAYEKAIEEQKIDPIAQPHIELLGTEPVKFKATVPLKPVVTLGDYKSIRVAAQPVEVTEEMVDKTVDRLRQQRAVYSPVERPVQFGDMINADMQSNIGEKELLNEKDAPYRVMKDVPVPVAGFAEKLEGMVKDEEREFDLPFPDDYPSEEFKGKQAHFKIKLNGVKEPNLPAVDDAFVKTLNMQLETVEALRAKVRENLKKQSEDAEKARFEEKALDALVEAAKMEYPDVMLGAEIERVINREAEGLARRGLKIEDQLKAAGRTMEQFAEELKPSAEKRLVNTLALMELTKAEKLEVAKEEVSAEVDRLCKTSGEKAEQMRKFLEMPAMLESIENDMLTRKTMERLIAIARGEAEQAAPAEPAASPEASA